MEKDKVKAALAKEEEKRRYWIKINNYRETPLSVVYAIIEHTGRTDWKSIWLEAQSELSDWSGIKSLEHKQRVLTFIVEHQHLLK